jgi:hypothetical protein
VVGVGAGHQGGRVSISGRGKRGECPPAHTLPPEEGLDALQSFSNKVGRAVRSGKALDGEEVWITAEALGRERIAPIVEDPDQLAPLLDAFVPEKASS